MATNEQIESLKPKYRRRSPDVYFPRDILYSKAFEKLVHSRLPAVFVYMIFRTKLRPVKYAGTKQKRSGKSAYYYENDEQLQFSYKEAKDKFGISANSFQRTIDLLIETGLLDIARLGGGTQGCCTLFAISDRWQQYDTSEFVRKKRPKRLIHHGFTRGNQLGKESRKKTEPTCVNDRGALSLTTGV